MVELFAGIGGFALAFERCGFHRALGNAIVPQVAQVIAQRILEIELGI